MNTKHIVYVKGQPVEFESPLTNAEALAQLRSLPVKSEFVTSLLGREVLSPLQMSWAHKLVLDAKRRAPDSGEIDMDLRALVGMLRQAAGAQKRFPRIVLRRDGAPAITVSLLGDGTRHPGAVLVRSGTTTHALVHRDGMRVLPRFAFEEVREVLLALARDPSRVLAQHGIATGVCCYCGRPLSTAESRSVGYGPICAEQFGLPWGDTSVADAADAAAKITAAELTQQGAR